MSIVASQLIARVSTDGAEATTAKLFGVGSAAEETNVKLSRLALGGAVIAGAGLAILTGVAVKMAGDFQQSMTQLVTGAGESRSNLKMVSDGILQMSIDTATASDKLAAGMFNVESASYRGAAGLTVEKAAAEGAKAENSDLASTTDVLTTTMHGLHAGASLAVSIMNSLIATERDGKMRMDDLTGAMKNVLPISSALHIHLADVEGALATMAASGDKGASAGTHLAMMFKMLSNPIGAASKEMKAMGIDSIKLAETMRTSLPDALKMIQDAVAQHFTPGSVEYQRAIQTILGGSKSGIAGLEILGGSFKDLEKNTRDAADALRKGGKDVENWDIIQKNFNFQLDAGKNAVEALFIKVGTSLLPSLTQLLATTTPLITSFTDWATSGHALNDVITTFNANTHTLVPLLAGLGAVLLASVVPATLSLAAGVIAATWPFLALGVAVGGLAALFLQFHPEVTTIAGAFQAMWPIVQNTGIALAVFFTPAIIKAGIEAVISAAKITYNFVASLILTGAQGWAAAGKLAVYIASLIATGAQAAIAGAIVAGRFVFALIASGTQAVIAAGKLAVAYVGSLIATSAEAGITASTLYAGVIPALTATGVAATVAAGPILALGAIAAGTFLLIANKAYIMDKSVQMSTGEMVGAAQIRFHQMASGGIADSQNMQNKVNNAAINMKNTVTSNMSSMSSQSIGDISTLTSDAITMFANMGNQVGIDMANMSSTAIGYWNGVADYIANHPINGSVTYQTHGNIQQHAEGTDYAPGGLSWVGERGPEIMYIPKGAQIIPNNKIGGSTTAAGPAGPTHIHVDVYLDGQRMTGAMMPRIVSAVRQATGARF